MGRIRHDGAVKVRPGRRASRLTGMDVRPAVRRVPPAAGAVAASVGGWALGTVLGAVGKMRRGKPLHPRGLLYPARLDVRGAPHPWGVPLLDHRAEHPCLVRVSRAMGLPAELPDIHGVAVRLPSPDGPADVLFATTGTGRLTRYLLLLRRSGLSPMTTLLPVRTAAGPLQLRLVPDRGTTGRRAWQVSAAGPGDARWEPVGRLVADPQPVAPDPDPPLRFDPVRNLPAGMTQYRWVRNVRDPAYVLARRWSPASIWRAARGGAPHHGSRSAGPSSRRDTRTSA